MPATHLVFDVNETLLDLSPLDAVFEDLFGKRQARQRWFAQLLHWSTITTLTDRFVGFTTLAGHCLDQIAAQADVALSQAGRERVFDTVSTLPPHADVVDGLKQLRDAGFSITALTNSAQATVDRQFEYNGLTDRFDRVLSVESSHRYKPHPDAYAVARDALGVQPAEIRLIAAHDWDVTGAIRVGMRGAFVARGGGTINAAGERPDIVGDDLSAVVQQIIAHDTPA